MNEVATKWVAALRSDKYENGRFALRRDNLYCCLGVLCDLYAQEHNCIGWNEVVDESYDRAMVFVDAEGRDQANYLTEDVRAWAGMTSFTGALDTADRTSLAKMNDDNATFSEIADAIEDNYDELFDN